MALKIKNCINNKLGLENMYHFLNQISPPLPSKAYEWKGPETSVPVFGKGSAVFGCVDFSPSVSRIPPSHGVLIYWKSESNF